MEIFLNERAVNKTDDNEWIDTPNSRCFINAYFFHVNTYKDILAELSFMWSKIKIPQCRLNSVNIYTLQHKSLQNNKYISVAIKKKVSVNFRHF